MANFRIFIDAATLKPSSSFATGISPLIFPHLYRCGHIEASLGTWTISRAQADFRIFIDAATLKRFRTGYLDFRLQSHFRIFIDAATLKHWMVSKDGH